MAHLCDPNLPACFTKAEAKQHFSDVALEEASHSAGFMALCVVGDDWSYVNLKEEEGKYFVSAPPGH